MRRWLIRLFGLDTWMRGIEQRIGECKILIQDRVLTVEGENRALRDENTKLLDAFIALKVKPPETKETTLGRRIPAGIVAQQRAYEAYMKDAREREGAEV